MIALAEDENLSRIEKSIRASRGQSMRVNVTDEGVKTRKIKDGDS
jgi:hypothetical protein